MVNHPTLLPRSGVSRRGRHAERSVELEFDYPNAGPPTGNGSRPTDREEPRRSGGRHLKARISVLRRLKIIMFASYVGRHGPRRPLFPGTYRGRHRHTPDLVDVASAAVTATGRASDQLRATWMAVGVLAVAWFTQRPLTGLTSDAPWLNFYVLQPLIWAAFAIGAFRLYRRLEDSLPFSWTIARIAFLAGLFQASAFISTGLAVGFGDNASSGELANVPLNILYFTALAAGVELTRAVVFQVWQRISEVGAFVAVTTIFAAATVPIGQWEPITDLDTLFRVGVGQYLPALTLSAVLTSFTAGGGIVVSAAYRLPLLGTAWLFPILPALDWPLRALIDTALPLVALALGRSLYEGTREFAERYPEDFDDDPPVDTRRRWPRWATTGVTAVLVVLFATGVFGVKPYLLAGVSMEPSFERGDVVIIRDIPTESLAVNDVIRYRQSTFDLVHRIVDIQETDGDRVFITKGDNVGRADPPVAAERISGKVVFVLPKIGWPSLWVRELMTGR